MIVYRMSKKKVIPEVVIPKSDEEEIESEEEEIIEAPKNLNEF